MNMKYPHGIHIARGLALLSSVACYPKADDVCRTPRNIYIVPAGCYCLFHIFTNFVVVEASVRMLTYRI